MSTRSDPGGGRILLATDGSEAADLAARAAIELAEGAGFELHVVYVDPLPGFLTEGHSSRVGYDRALYEEIVEESRQKLRQLTWRVKAAGGTVAGSHLGLRGVVEEIVALADEIGADLVVVGSRGRGRMRRALAGSVSGAVVRRARCPVMVVPSRRAAGGLMARVRGWLRSRKGTPGEVATRG